MKSYVIVNKKRFSVFVGFLFLTLALLFLGLFLLFSSRSAYGIGQDQYEERILERGETIWQLARDRADQQGKDVRDLVREIYQVNELGPGPVEAGTRLLLPRF